MALAQLNVTLGLQIQSFQKSLNRLERDINRFQRRFETIGTNLTQSISLPLAALAGSATQAFGEFESLERAFAAVAAEGTNVGAEIERLRKIAQAPGLGFNQAVQASTRLQAVGLSAAEAARVVEQFGNAVARSGGGAESLDGAVLALTQIASKGKISAEEINQLNERIFEIRPALQAAFGTADSEQLQKLGISAEEFIARTTEEFAKLERVNGGLANSFENFRDSGRQALADIGREIATAINLEDVLNRISSALETAATFFRNLSPETKRLAINIGLIAIAAGPVLIAVAKLSSLFTLATQGAKILLGGVRSLASAMIFFTTPVGLVIAGITALIAAAIYLYNRFELIRKIANGLIDGFKALGALAKTVAGNIAQGFVDLFQGNFRDALNGFKDAFTQGSLVNVGKEFAQGFGDGFQDGTNRINASIDSIKNKLRQLATPAASAATAAAGAPLTQAFDLSGFEAAAPTAAPAKPGEAKKPTPRETFDIAPLQGYALALQTVTSQTDVFSEAAIRAKANTDSFVASLANFTRPSELVIALGDAVLAAGNAFADLAAQGETSLRKLGQAALQAARQTISAFIREGVAGIVRNILAGPTGKALGPAALAVAAAAGGGAALLFNSLLNKITAPKLAKGGLAFAPTLAVVGDNPAARTDPEVIAPLSRLRDMLGGSMGGGFVAEARISGTDLALLVRRANLRNERIR